MSMKIKLEKIPKIMRSKLQNPRAKFVCQQEIYNAWKYAKGGKVSV